jgi:hypothetical protein
VEREAALGEGVNDKNGLDIGNHGWPTHHGKRENQEAESAIDVILPNRPIVNWTVLADDHTTGSNHDGIK